MYPDDTSHFANNSRNSVKGCGCFFSLKLLHALNTHGYKTIPFYYICCMEPLKNILILCTGNSCRSQMAEGFLNLFLYDKARVFSAGVEVHGLNPRAVKVMAEDGVDISMQTSNHVEEYIHMDFDFVITVCDHAAEVCPVFPGAKEIIHHSFPDPAKAKGSEAEIMDAFRDTRDEIKDWFKDFADALVL